MIQRVLGRGLLAPVATTVLAFSLLGSGCSGDDDDDTTAGRGGKGGTAGKGGAGGKAGKGGTAGTGVTAGGKGGVAGKAGGGSSGRGGSSGASAGGDAGTGGTTGGTSAGDAGESGNGGAAGEAGGGGEAGEVGVFRPEIRPFTQERLEGLNVAEGFAVNAFATDLGNPRMLAVHGEHVYVTRPETGDVVRLVDANANGASDSTTTVATGLVNVHGIAFNGDVVYLATVNQVLRGDVDAEGNFDGLTAIITDLPDGGQHYRRTLGVGPDAALYISVGSTCDACAEPDLENATILRASLDGTTRAVFASGLRNTIGFGWHPDSDELWGMDHGSDMRGDDLPPEELNLLVQGRNYGWPYCYGDRNVDPLIGDPAGTTKEEYCADTEASVLGAQAHSAPIGLTFYSGTSFPSAYRDDAFVAFHGSWNRSLPVGYKVVRVRFEGGTPAAFEDLVSGFLIEDGAAVFGRPAGITTGPDGSLLFSDDENGVIYRVAASP
jgi:glucose/arabinose dehydrogenase